MEFETLQRRIARFCGQVYRLEQEFLAMSPHQSRTLSEEISLRNKHAEVIKTAAELKKAAEVLVIESFKNVCWLFSHLKAISGVVLHQPFCITTGTFNPPTYCEDQCVCFISFSSLAFFSFVVFLSFYCNFFLLEWYLVSVL